MRRHWIEVVGIPDQGDEETTWGVRQRLIEALSERDGKEIVISFLNVPALTREWWERNIEIFRPIKFSDWERIRLCYVPSQADLEKIRQNLWKLHVSSLVGGYFARSEVATARAKASVRPTSPIQSRSRSRSSRGQDSHRKAGE